MKDTIQFLEFIRILIDLWLHRSKEFFGQMNNYQLVKEDEVPSS
jgi:hypothetical protein